MIRASIHIQKSIYKWYQPNLGSTAAEVTIGDSKYQLGRIRRFSSQNLCFELRDSAGKLIKKWELKYKWNGTAFMEVSAEQEYKIWYHQGFFGRPLFETPTEKLPAFLNLSGNTRTFRLGDMKFQHHDYQSSINLTSPADKIHSAVLIADLLFNYPYQNDNSSGA